MPYRVVPFVNDCYYHVYNRGTEKRQTFLSDRDYRRFLQTLYYYQFKGPKPRFSTHKKLKILNLEALPKIVEIISYCLMPNHFHLLLRQLSNGGISEFTSKVTNSYTKYFNTKQNRVGPLFQGQFKAVLVETDEHLAHLSRYIHLNPYVSDLTEDWQHYPYSSYIDFENSNPSNLVKPEIILKMFKGIQEYKKFVQDHADYAHELERIKHLRLEEE